MAEITLPSGVVLPVAEDDPMGGKIMFRHSLAALSENLCPMCSLPLNDRRECLDRRHRSTRFGVTNLGTPRVEIHEHYLDVLSLLAGSL
jgi:hypothetical protein